jgi:hypothetical protein
MLEFWIETDRVHIGERFSVSFQRTLRLPDDGRVYPLPPGLGAFPVRLVADYPSKVPPAWLEKGGVFIPMYQREALWLGFESAAWKPNTVKVAVGGVNALTGDPWVPALHNDPQDYLVVPDQPWLDGINAGSGTASGGVIRQFVATPLGMGDTVEAQVTGEERTGGIQLLVFEPKPGIFPDQAPFESTGEFEGMFFAAPSIQESSGSFEMGLAAGGQMEQKIYPDPHGLETWDPETYGELWVHIVNSLQYWAITGEEAPPSPVDAQTYTQYGLPWFALYDDEAETLAAAQKLGSVKSLQQREKERGTGETESSVEIDSGQVHKLKPGKSRKSGK